MCIQDDKGQFLAAITEWIEPIMVVGEAMVFKGSQLD
jgi:hypothetical protein